MQCDSTLLLMLQKPEEYPQDSYDATILSLIHETRKAIAKKAKEQGAIITDDEFIVGHLYPSKTPSTELECRDYGRAAMSVMITFLDWVALEWQRPVKPTTLLKNFLYDLGFVGLLAVDGSYRMRSHVLADNFNFRNIYSTYLYEQKTERIYSEALCIFGLRQTLEHKFANLFGFVGSIPEMKIQHGFWPEILHKYVSSKKLRFADASLDIHRIMRVYNWTNDSIHGMRTDFVWSVWKAIQMCRPMFMSMTAGGMCSTVDSATILEHDFLQMRADAVDAISKKLIYEGESCEVIFAKPGVIVIDSGNHVTKRFDAEDRKVVHGSRKRKEIVVMEKLKQILPDNYGLTEEDATAIAENIREILK